MDNPEPFIQEEPLVYCPRCRQKTDNLTSQHIPVVVFFGVGYACMSVLFWLEARRTRMKLEQLLR